MTKTQIWLSGFVLLFAALFFLGRITKNEEPEGKMQKAQMAQQSNNEIAAEQLVTRLNCTNCHGGDLAGSAMAPSLHGLKNSWNRDNLINYLRNPSAYMSSEKFKEYKDKYKNVVMPSYNNIEVKELGKIADYLLSIQ